MASDIESKIWYDLVHAKNGDEYLCLYLVQQENIRKGFKITTITLSVTGIVCGYKSVVVPMIVSFAIICLMQIATSIESFIIRSDDGMTRLRELRLLYYGRIIDIEKLFDAVRNGRISDEDAASQFFALRESAKKIEDLENKVNVKTHRRLRSKARTSALNYLNTYYPS